MECIDKKKCGIAETSKILGDTWTMLIVRELLKGSKRFNQLQNAFADDELESKLSSKTLTDRLKFLAEKEIINKKVIVEDSVHPIYELTEKGKDLSVVFDSLREYGDKHLN